MLPVSEACLIPLQKAQNKIYKTLIINDKKTNSFLNYRKRIDLIFHI